MKKLFIPLLIMSTALYFIGCEGSRGPQGAASENPVFINGSISSMPYSSMYPNQINANLNIVCSPSNASAYINELPMKSGAMGENSPMGLPYYYRDLPLSLGDSVHLQVQYESAAGDTVEAWADIVIPGDFEVTAPDTYYYILTPGEDLQISWTPSTGADAYSVLLRLQYQYLNLQGDTVKYAESWVRICDDDTVEVFDAELLFPDTSDIDYLTTFEGLIGVDAINGPYSEGQPGNVLGEGIGFFSSTVRAANCDYYFDIYLSGY